MTVNWIFLLIISVPFSILLVYLRGRLAAWRVRFSSHDVDAILLAPVLFIAIHRDVNWSIQALLFYLMTHQEMPEYDTTFTGEVQSKSAQHLQPFFLVFYSSVAL